jgi:hypothetical protein
MAADNVSKNAVVTDGEIDAEFARSTEWYTRRGKKVPAAAVAQLKEGIRASLRKDKGKKAVDEYIAGLRKKAKITVNDAVLPKV